MAFQRIPPLQPGDRHNRLTATGRKRRFTNRRNSKDKRWEYEFLCDCGETIWRPAFRVQREYVKSCGCYTREAHRERVTRHGMTKTAEYNIWASMIKRCHKPSHKSFPKYGDRGIQVCDRWRYSFENFFADMGPRPNPQHSIDRIDTNGNYEPANCRWASQEVQNRNRRSNHWVTINGQTKVVIDWAREYGIAHPMLYARLKAGWSPERALTTPSRKRAGDRPHRRTES